MTNDEIRIVFGQNLRTLIGLHYAGNVSMACRDMGVNRTQFNRYLSSESWPRPDVLMTICNHFKTDSRILTQPLDSFGKSRTAKMLSEVYDMENFGIDKHSWNCAVRTVAVVSGCYPEFIALDREVVDAQG